MENEFLAVLRCLDGNNGREGRNEMTNYEIDSPPKKPHTLFESTLNEIDSNWVLPFLIVPFVIVIYYIVVFAYTSNLSALFTHYYSFGTLQNLVPSILIYDGILNLLFFIVLVPLFSFSISTVNNTFKRYKIALFVSIFAFIVGLVAEFLSVNIYGKSLYTYGQSGVAFAMFGIVLGVAFVLMLEGFGNRNFLMWFVNLALIGIISVMILISPTQFFNITPHINYMAHELAMVFGILCGLLFGFTTLKPVNGDII